MVNAKKSLVDRVSFFLLILFVLVLPFGQLIRFENPLFSYPPAIYPHEIIMLVSVLTLSIGKAKPSGVFKNLIWVAMSLSFSYLLSVFLFPGIGKIGILYLGRIWMYVLYFMFVKRQIGVFPKKDILNLLNISFLSALILGLMQYFLFPDLRSLKFLGWDDHLFRLTGTFLDPGYTGIIFVFGFNLCIYLYLARKSKVYIAQALLFVFGLLLTYSRASYLAFIASLVAVYLTQRSLMKPLLVIASVFLVSIFLLPRPPSEGVYLERTNSIGLRLSDYTQTLQIFTKSPIFGVGFNNICYFKPHVSGQDQPLSHSCFGADSSLLLVLATTGIIGLMVFVDRVLTIGKYTLFEYRRLLFPVVAGLFVHSLFINSLFYTFVLGYTVILLAVSTKD